MSHNNTDEKKQPPEVPNIDTKKERPKVDTDALAKSLQEKKGQVGNNKPVNK